MPPAVGRRDAGQRRIVATAAAGVLIVVAAVAGWAVGRRHESTPSDAPSIATPAPTSAPSTPTPRSAPTPTATEFPADTSPVALCEADLAGLLRRYGGLPGIDYSPLAQSHEVITLPLPEDPATTQVLLVNSTLMARCVIAPFDPTLPNTLVNRVREGASVTEVDDGSARPPERDGVVVVSVGSTTPASTDPDEVASSSIVGRVGPDVAHVDVAYPDGTRRQAALASGWFAVSASVPASTPLNEARLEWRLRDGRAGSGRVDLLDAETTDEQCAAQPGCVSVALALLRVEAIATDRSAQAVALTDGFVTDDERADARTAFRACLLAEGFTTHVIGEPAEEHVYVIKPGATDAERAAVEERCHRDTDDVLDRAISLLDAQRRTQAG